MAELRRSTLNQLKRINSEIKKQGGKTDRSSDSEKNVSNSLFVHDPVDAHKSGKRHICTYEEHSKIDIPDADLTVKMKNESNTDFFLDDLLTENKINRETFFDDLSKNFQKITSEIQKLQKNDERIINHFTEEIKKLRQEITEKTGMINQKIDNLIVKNELKQ
jgi:hypothetical protein